MRWTSTLFLHKFWIFHKIHLIFALRIIEFTPLEAECPAASCGDECSASS